MVVNMIDLDIEAKNFYQAQMKIDVVRSIFAASNCLPDESVVADDEYSKLMVTLKLPKLSVEVSSLLAWLKVKILVYLSLLTGMMIALIIQRLESISDLKWKLKQIDVPSMYYRNRSEKVIITQVKDLQEEFDKKDMSIPRWIRHHHSCCCYMCSHPTILPVAFQFYLIQVMQDIVILAVCML